jgi:hypothetical protein
MSPDYKALCAELEGLLIKLREMVLADARFLLDKDSGAGIYGVELDISIDESLTRARAELAQPEQDDKTLKSIRETTPRYRMSVIVSTNDSAIDTRMNVIWQALDPSKEILESVSLPEQLPPLGNQ